jgi:hypothetical protein
LTDPRQQPPTWATLGQARKALAPRPPEVADLSDDEFLSAYVLALHDAGRLGWPNGDPDHDAELAAFQAHLRTVSDAELQQLRQASFARCRDLFHPVQPVGQRYE